MSQILLKLSQNWRSGLTVALVSLPLSIALSIASGAGPVTGVITAFWAGMVAAIFGGSEFNIVGPAGALTTILSSFAFVYGPENLPFLSILVGLIILLIYLFNLERYLILIPSSVIYEFATGVAILIAFGQINDALGLNIKASPHFLEKFRTPN
jgi:SulP family sulfate permease